ncbi:MAG: universal stress protein [Ramlibacter sp.]
MSLYKRILVPVDGSEASNRALDAALQLARDSGGLVRAMHDLNELAYITPYEDSAMTAESARGLAQQVLQGALAACEKAGVPADSRLVEAPGRRLGDTVAAEATDWQADLVVIGTHGRRGLQRLLLGSGAEQIIRLAPVPVLVVREAPHPQS